MKPFVSIIIPCFNVENYIEKTLKSIMNQTFDNYEVIVVNDGSTDHTEQIIQSVISNNKKFRYFFKNNGGLSDARNYGIDKALGEFLLFLDGDDQLADKTIELLTLEQTNFNADVVGCNFGYDLETFSYKNNQGRIIGKESLIDIYLQNKKECEESVCNKLFRKSLFDDLRFDVGRYHEDTFILYKLLEKCNQYVYLDEDLYNVTTRKGSITRNVYTDKHFDKVVACREIYYFYKVTTHKKLAYNKYFGTLLYFVLKTNKKNVSKNNEAVKELRCECKTNLKMLDLRFYPFYFLVRLNLITLISI